MRLLLETTPLQGAGAGRGLGRYVRELRSALRAQGELAEFSLAMGDHRLAEIAALPARHRAIGRHPHDLLYAPTALHVPAVSRRPWVASILDTIPLEVVSHRRTGAKTAAMFRLAARADAVLTLSQDAAERVASRLRVAPDRIVVAALPCALRPTDAARAPRPDGLPSRPYAVAMADISTPDPRKRIPWYEAVGRALAGVGAELVLVGPGTDSPAAPAHTTGLGRLDDAAWSSVLSGADAFVFCSAFEGQGLPPLEAMAHGVPVVAMSNTAVREVVGDAGVLVPESTPAGQAAAGPHAASDEDAGRLSAAVLSLLADPDRRRRLAAAGAARAATFTTASFREGVQRAGDVALSARGGG